MMSIQGASRFLYARMVCRSGTVIEAPFRWVASFLCVAMSAATNGGAPQVIGNAINPTNQKVYLLLSQSKWTEARDKAIELGGYLTTINDGAENSFIYNTFSNFGGLNRNLWIGLYDLDPNVNSLSRPVRRLEFGWVNEEPVTYSNWSPVEPNNPNSPEPGTWESYVHIWGPGDINHGKWNNLQDLQAVFGVQVCGVVETCLLSSGVVSQNACVGDLVTFNLNLVGSGPFALQWRKNNEAIALDDNPTSQSQTLTISGVSFDDAGVYDCLITNTCGTVLSAAGSLAIVRDSPGDVTCDGDVDVDDLLAVINSWGLCPPACPADIAPEPNGDGTVNVDDLLAVINNWT